MSAIPAIKLSIRIKNVPLSNSNRMVESIIASLVGYRLSN